MKPSLLKGAVTVVMALLATTGQAQVTYQYEQSRVVFYQSNQSLAHINYAQLAANAQATLPGFLERARRPGAVEGRYLVQIAIPAPEGIERVWAGISFPRGRNFGVYLVHSPSQASAGIFDHYVISPEDILDWLYAEPDGTLHGGYSMRAELPTYPAALANDLRQRFAPLPAVVIQ